MESSLVYSLINMHLFFLTFDDMQIEKKNRNSLKKNIYISFSLFLFWFINDDQSFNTTTSF